MSVKVFKFGGASVRDSSNVQNVKDIIGRYAADKLVIVVSAMGKTTNALELAVWAFIDGDTQRYQSLLEDIMNQHLDTAKELGISTDKLALKLQTFVEEADRSLEIAKGIGKSAVYDQIVSLGELFSTTIMVSYLQSQGLKSSWLDIRKVIAADDHFRSAKVDFTATQKNIDEQIKNELSKCDILITQGFIAASPDGMTVTLGREGSDYTAAILAYALDVNDLAIWKDVPGVLTADPRRFENVEKIDKMSYKEAIEMTYYGAQVIHPKTIRPLQNKGIRLHVKSFLDPEKEGTIISADGLLNYPPIVVIQDDVVLMQISSKDFSFIAENHLNRIFELLNKYDVSLRTMRNSAISFTICTKHPGDDELQALLQDLEHEFMVDVFKNLQLYTLRYFNKNLIQSLTANKVVLFEERMKYTIQMVVRPALELKEKMNGDKP